MKTVKAENEYMCGYGLLKRQQNRTIIRIPCISIEETHAD
jgi:hypothetical protein